MGDTEVVVVDIVEAIIIIREDIIKEEVVVAVGKIGVVGKEGSGRLPRVCLQVGRGGGRARALIAVLLTSQGRGRHGDAGGSEKGIAPTNSPTTAGPASYRSGSVLTEKHGHSRAPNLDLDTGNAGTGG